MNVNEKLLEKLKYIETNLYDFSDETKTLIFDSITSILNNEPIDSDIVKYLFRGWWVSELAEKQKQLTRDDFESYGRNL